MWSFLAHPEYLISGSLRFTLNIACRFVADKNAYVYMVWELGLVAYDVGSLCSRAVARNAVRYNLLSVLRSAV